MKLFALLLLKFVCLSVGTNPEVEEAFDPDSGETSFQRRYVISVANKQEDCYYISDVKTNQVINFHFVVSIIVNILKPKYILAYLEHISAFSILLAYDLLEHPVAPLSGASRPPRGLG